MNTFTSRRLFLVLLTVFVLMASWFNPVTERAKAEVQGGLERALTVFAAARVIGAVVSVAQGTQVNLQPGGVGIGLAPGQALQPLDHLIDQFAEVMLIASVSFGIQLLLLNIGTHWVVSALASVAVIAVALLRWRDVPASGRWLQPVLVLLLVMRFAVPLSVMGNEALYRWFMAEEFHKELAVLEHSPKTVLGHKDASASTEESIGGRFQEWRKSLPDLKARYDAILDAAAGWSRTIVKLIVYFVVQTVVFPIAFLWCAWRFAKLSARVAFPLDTGSVA